MKYPDSLDVAQPGLSASEGTADQWTAEDITLGEDTCKEDHKAYGTPKTAEELCRH